MTWKLSLEMREMIIIIMPWRICGQQSAEQPTSSRSVWRMPVLPLMQWAFPHAPLLLPQRPFTSTSSPSFTASLSKTLQRCLSSWIFMQCWVTTWSVSWQYILLFIPSVMQGSHLLSSTFHSQNSKSDLKFTSSKSPTSTQKRLPPRHLLSLPNHLIETGNMADTMLPFYRWTSHTNGRCLGCKVCGPHKLVVSGL